jgi:DNA-binding PadR family transcriptional regulator
MILNDFSDSELLILGLIAEMPRHGYELEQVIEKRGMREWTQIGFSSIYYVLGKLEKRGLVLAEMPEATKARKRYEITEKGTEALVDQTLAALKTVQPTYPTLLLGMIHLSTLTQDQAVSALKIRKEALTVELERINNIHFEQQPLPDYINAIFEFSIGQLQAEMDWIDKTLSYMATKRWI